MKARKKRKKKKLRKNEIKDSDKKGSTIFFKGDRMNLNKAI